SVALAPNYTQVLDFGAYRARVLNQASYWWGTEAELPPARVEIIPAAEHADAAAAVASFEIPAGADAYKMGDLLVSVSSRPVDTTSWPYTYETTVEVFDLSDPRAPARRGSMTRDELVS